MALKPLTDLMPTLFAALDIVSREITGLIPAVTINSAPIGAAKGETIRIPKANAAQAQDIVPGVPPTTGDPDLDYVDMTIQKSRTVPVRWNGEEQLGVRNGGQYNVILAQQFAQAMRRLANEVEADLSLLYAGASRAYGTAGTAPFAAGIDDLAMIRKVLVDNGAPTTDLQLVVNTLAGAKLRSLMQLTKANEAGSDATLRRGILLDLLGFAIRESGQIAQHAAGSITPSSGSALVNNSAGYARGDSVIAFDGASAVALKAGDLVSFGGNDKYVVAANAAASPLSIAAPGLMASVADNTAITVSGAYTPSLAFDRNAIQLIVRPPAVPEGGDSAADRAPLTDPVSGIPFQLAVYRDYQIVRYEVCLAWGVKLIKPEHVAILLG